MVDDGIFINKNLNNFNYILFIEIDYKNISLIFKTYVFHFKFSNVGGYFNVNVKVCVCVHYFNTTITSGPLILKRALNTNVTRLNIVDTSYILPNNNSLKTFVFQFVKPEIYEVKTFRVACLGNYFILRN